MFVRLIFWTLTVAMTTGMSVTSKKCDPDTYFDPAIGRCDTCSVICEFAEIQGTVEECRSKCPDYAAVNGENVDKEVTTVKDSSTTTRTERYNGDYSSSSSVLESRTVIMLIIALCVVTITLCAAILTLAVWKVKGDIFYRDEIRKLRSHQSPMYRRTQDTHLNENGAVISALLAHPTDDV